MEEKENIGLSCRSEEKEERKEIHMERSIRKGRKGTRWKEKEVHDGKGMNERKIQGLKKRKEKRRHMNTRKANARERKIV